MTMNQTDDELQVLKALHRECSNIRVTCNKSYFKIQVLTYKHSESHPLFLLAQHRRAIAPPSHSQVHVNWAITR